jgi:hypothetical protein
MSRAIHTDALSSTSMARVFSSEIGPQIPLAPEGLGTSLGMDDFAEELLKGWQTDAEGPSDKTDEEDNEDRSTDEDDSDEGTEETPDADEGDEDAGEETEEEADDEGEETDEDEEAPKKPKTLKDSDIVKVKVGDEELDVPVEKLKRLYGQEAALTRKSQEAAALRKTAEENGARHVAGLETLLNRAKERFAPYANIDWFVAAKELSSEELKAIRDEAGRAYEDVKFLEKELDGTLQQAEQQRVTTHRQEAQQALKELTDPKNGIPNFSEAVYDEMRMYGINAGLPAEVVNSITSAPILRLLHKAMLYDKGRKAVTKPLDTRNKKVLKSRTSSEETRKVITKSKKSEAQKRFQKSGSQDDLALAFLSDWTEE